DGDLAFTTDFRRLYATCLEHVFGLDPAAVLGPGYAPLEFVRAG
ncbi:MAG: Twin-arginine translocation pathway signal sequence domain-containing protein, partial [Planctomycetes bacterium]|nr:Twin-arginine translocation pathway signal sequence domain-containing protein [Planctomycetota bacterium]